MTLSFTGRKRLRKILRQDRRSREMPNLIEVQKTSYDQFLQVEKPEGGRKDEGLQAVFSSVFPIKDFSENPRCSNMWITISRSRNTTSRSASSAP
jgi:DNA-directed RNA polymerase subunit beta